MRSINNSDSKVELPEQKVSIHTTVYFVFPSRCSCAKPLVKWHGYTFTTWSSYRSSLYFCIIIEHLNFFKNWLAVFKRIRQKRNKMLLYVYIVVVNFSACYRVWTSGQLVSVEFLTRCCMFSCLKHYSLIIKHLKVILCSSL